MKGVIFIIITLIGFLAHFTYANELQVQSEDEFHLQQQSPLLKALQPKTTYIISFIVAVLLKVVSIPASLVLLVYRAIKATIACVLRLAVSSILYLVLALRGLLTKTVGLLNGILDLISKFA